MKNKVNLKVLIALAVLLLVLIMIAIGLNLFVKEPELLADPSDSTLNMQMQSPEATETSAVASDPTETEEATQQATQEPTYTTQEPTQSATEEPTQSATQEPTKGTGEKNASTKPGTTVTSKPSGGTVAQAEPLSFPYAIPGTNLVIQKIDSYDGVYLEDGSDRSVTGIAAMILVNNGSTAVEYANIAMTQNDTQLQFKATAIPAGAAVVVQESSATTYNSASYFQCSADVAELEKFEMSASLVKVEENENGSLTVTNLTEETIPCVRVFYKFSMEKGAIYVGGITYTAKIMELEPGVSQQVAPSHYASGSSEVMMVRTYDTAE